MANETVGGDPPEDREIVLGPQCTSAMFTGKRRTNGAPARTQSAESYFIFIGT